MRHETHRTGAIAELVVQRWAIEEGYAVSLPITEERYDLVIDTGADLNLLQVKRGYFQDCYADDKMSCDFRAGANNKGYDESEIDGFIVYNPDDEELYSLSIEEAPDSTTKKVSNWRKDMIWSRTQTELDAW